MSEDNRKRGHGNKMSQMNKNKGMKRSESTQTKNTTKPNLNKYSKMISKVEETGDARYLSYPKEMKQEGRANKTERMNKFDKTRKTDRPNKFEGTGRTDRPNKFEGTGRADRTKIIEGTERADRSDITSRFSKTDRTDRQGRADRKGKIGTAERTERTDRTERTERNERTDRTERTERKVRIGNSYEKSQHNYEEDKFDRKPSYNRNNAAVAKGSCRYLRECGGCNIQRQSYQEELKGKQKSVELLLNKFCKVEPIIGMKNPKHYRNKVHVVFDHDRKGNPVSGVYEEGTHRVVPIESCLIHNQKADAIIASIRGMLGSFKIKTYDEDTGYGLLRHVLIRTGFTSGEIMVVLVLSSPILPSKNNFVRALRAQHPEITTIVVNVNDKKTSMVLGDKEQVIYGKGYIEDSLCQKVFRISPKSFYQVNPAQTEVIYNKAIEMAGLTGKETVLDAYCGIGTIGIIASEHAKKVIGVELNKEAVRDANINAKLNEASNIEFYNNDAGKFMSQMAAQRETVDVVFMDPPRTGSNEEFMDALAILKPQKVVYISCNPITLERDLQYLTKKGYKAMKAIPVDMFPWTAHVECVIMMTNSGFEGK